MQITQLIQPLPKDESSIEVKRAVKTIHGSIGGPEETRTLDLSDANRTLSQRLDGAAPG